MSIIQVPATDAGTCGTGQIIHGTDVATDDGYGLLAMGTCARGCGCIRVRNREDL